MHLAKVWANSARGQNPRWPPQKQKLSYLHLYDKYSCVLWHHNYRFVHSHLQVLASILSIQLCSTNDFTLLSDADTNTSASFKGPARTDFLPPASLYRGPFAGGQTAPCVLNLGHRRRALHLSPAEQSGASVRMSTTFASKYRSALDGSRTTSSDK